MLDRELQSALMNWSVLHSGHETRRPYIGLSQIGNCELAQYECYMGGERFTPGQHLRSLISFELEAALIGRLRQIGLYVDTGESICLYDGLVQGHTDGVLRGGDVLEIKTLPREAYLPQNGRLSHKDYFQVQAYMHYTRRRCAQVVYLARDTGMLLAIGARYHAPTGERIAERVERLVEAIREVRAPACNCGRCGNGKRDG